MKCIFSRCSARMFSGASFFNHSVMPRSVTFRFLPSLRLEGEPCRFIAILWKKPFSWRLQLAVYNLERHIDKYFNNSLPGIVIQLAPHFCGLLFFASRSIVFAHSCLRQFNESHWQLCARFGFDIAVSTQRSEFQ